MNYTIDRRQFVKGAGVAGAIGIATALGTTATITNPALANETSNGESSQADVSQEQQPQATQSYTPGTYQATATGRNGDVTVSVTFSDNAIESIEIGDNQETDDMCYLPFNVVTAAILEGQTTNVDTVAGATLSSFAVINAVSDAVNQAGGDTSALPAFDPASIAQAMTPGTYTGEAYGKWKKGSIEGERFGCPATIEPTQVQVTVDETSITDIQVISCSDTPGFYEVAVDQIPQRIIDQQSLFVDTCTGSTMTAIAIQDAVAKALDQAGANLAGFAQRTEKVTAQESYDADLCIIGAGTAGTTAALKAVEEGLKVVVLEKCQRISGEGSCATGALAVGSRLDEEAGNHVSVDEVFHNMMDYAYWKINASLVHNILANSGEMVNWLQDHWDEQGQAGFSAPKNTEGTSIAHDYGKGTEKFQVLWDNYIVANGATLLLECPADEILVEDGTITGVHATKQDGTSVTVNAPAVLVCTGGFGGNQMMQREILGSSDFYLNGVATNTGDGVRMCMDLDCVLSTEVSPHLAEFCSNDVCDFYAGYMKFLNQAGLLMVDPAGCRYMDESYCITHALARGASGLRRAGSTYIIFTQADFDSLLNHGVHELLSQEYIEENQMRSRILVDSYYTLQDEMDEAIAKGQAFKADTLEELGEACQFDAESWNSTLETYLAAIDAGEDTLFGKVPELLHPLAEGPFYAVRVISPIDGTYNGIKVDDHQRAIGPDNRPAPAGLFVAGQDSGGYFSYPYTDYVGATCGYALTSGMVAIQYIKEYLTK